MLNTNTIHNVLNILISLSALFVAVLLATGCSQFGDGMLECSQSFLSPQITAFAIAGLSAFKIVINIVRDGMSGLVKPQPPVGK
ncbi:MAG: hypothetical protein QM636_12190 [Rhizobium sp.]